MRPADLIIIAILVFVIVADVLLVVFKRRTITNRYTSFGREFAFPFYAWGVIGGHFVGSGQKITGLLVGVAIILLAGLSISGAHRLAIYCKLDPPWWIGVIYLAIGVPVGLVFWSH